MGKGLPKKYAKMGFKKGWAAYKRTKGKTRTKRRTATKRRPVRRKRRLQTKQKKGGRSMGKAFHIAPNLGLIAYPLSTAIAGFQGGVPWDQTVSAIASGYVGYDMSTGEFRTDRMMMNYGAIFAGFIVSWLASKTGVNKKLYKGVNL